MAQLFPGSQDLVRTNDSTFFAASKAKERKKTLKIEQRSRDAGKNRANTSGVGKSNNYYDDIYIP